MAHMLPPQMAALPLHLTLILSGWQGLNAVSHLPKAVSDNWSSQLAAQSLPNTAAPLAKLLVSLLDDPQLAAAAESEARKRAVEFLHGAERYRQAHYRRDVDEPVIASIIGNSRLLRYRPETKARATVFLVPSLINRYYILDLTRRLSFARFLAGQGFDVYIIDWGTPSALERDFDCSDYIIDRLLPFVHEAKSRLPLILGGYCMGGLLALGLANLEPKLVDGIACIATPWDFASPDFPRIPFDAVALERFLSDENGARVLSAGVIQYLFHYVNPLPFQARIREFGRMEENHPQRQPFLASQHWAADGVPMVERVARECLLGWIGGNIPARGMWKVGGKTVNPAGLKHPAFLALSHEDTIVPASCSLPLAESMKQAEVIATRCGHIGMMVGRSRRRTLWEPFSSWVMRQFV